MKKITKDTILSNILKEPGAEKILVKYNFPCLTCPLGKMEIEMLKIGDVCKAYDINLQKVLKDLNKK